MRAMALSDPLGGVKIQGQVEAFYFGMWQALKMGIDPLTYRKMNIRDLEMLKVIENGMTERESRRLAISKALAGIGGK